MLVAQRHVLAQGMIPCCRQVVDPMPRLPAQDALADETLHRVEEQSHGSTPAAADRQLACLPGVGQLAIASESSGRHMFPEVFASSSTDASGSGPAAGDGASAFFKLLSGGMERHTVAGGPLPAFDFISQGYVAVSRHASGKRGESRSRVGELLQLATCFAARSLSLSLSVSLRGARSAFN